MKNRQYSVLLYFMLLGLYGPTIYADEGGVGFWVPGYFGALAAAPLQPGLSFASVYYHSTVSSGAEVAFARQVTLGNIHKRFTGQLNVELNADVDLFFAIPSYTFKKKILNGQAMVAMAIPYGRSQAAVNATFLGNLGIGSGFVLGRSRSDSVTSVGDLAPLASLRWNHNTNNFMIYIAESVPAGAYDAKRLANLGTNHPSLDSGIGYTYFNPETGYEFSSVVGWTYNFENKRTHYQNGVDMHWDFSASKFFAKKTQLGAVGYIYQQLSCDRGSGNFVGCFKSRVFSAGPQIGYLKVFKQVQVLLNLKGYKEFDAQARASGWNSWLTLSISPFNTTG